MKRARPDQASSAEDESGLMSVVRDMSRQIEEKADRLNLRSASVRRIIKEVLSDQDVVCMFRDYLRCDGAAAAAYEPKLTRSQAKRQCLETAEAAAAAEQGDAENDDDEEDGDYVASEGEDEEEDDEEEEVEDDDEEDNAVEEDAGRNDEAKNAAAAAAAEASSYATRSRCPIPDFSWEKCEEAILKSDFYLGDFALDDIDLDSGPSTVSSTSAPPPPLSLPPPQAETPRPSASGPTAEEESGAADEDNDEAEFRNFLRDIYLDRIEQADPPDEAEVDADFNVMAEPEEAYQEDFFEDLRYNRASRIPKRELRDLLDEICSDLFEAPLAVRDQPGGASPPSSPAQQQQQQQQEEQEEAEDHDQSYLMLPPREFTQEQRLELSKQLTMYVQLLCTMKLTCHQEAPDLAEAALIHLTELKLLADAREASSSAPSILRVANLDAAVALADNFIGLSDNRLRVCLNGPTRFLSSSAADQAPEAAAESTIIMPPQLCGLMLSSSVFPYAQLFPPGMAATMTRCKRLSFTPSEDRLLLLGLAQFGHRRDVFQLISKYTMPWRSGYAVSARCVYLSKQHSLLFKDSLCPARVLTRSVIVACLRRRKLQFSSQAGQSSASSSSSQHPQPPSPSRSPTGQPLPPDTELDFPRVNWITGVPLLTGCVLDRPADWCHLPQLFRQHLLLERPSLRSRLLKPSEPTPLERDTVLDRASQLFKRCRILFKDFRRERLLHVRLLWHNADLAPPIMQFAVAAPTLPAQPHRRGRRGHRTLTVRAALLARGRRPHDRSPTRLSLPPPQPPLPQMPLDAASADCAMQVKRTVKEYLFSRLQSAWAPSALSPPPPPPPPLPPPPLPLRSSACRPILPKPPSLQSASSMSRVLAASADTCRIASDLILAELRSRRRNRLVVSVAAASAAESAVGFAPPEFAPPPLLSLLTMPMVPPLIQPISPNPAEPSPAIREDLLDGAVFAADSVGFAYFQPKPGSPEAMDCDSNAQLAPPAHAQPAAVDEEVHTLSPEAIPTLSCLPYLSDFLQSNTFKELRRGRWKPGRSGRLDQENLDQLVTDDPCETGRTDGGIDDDRDIEFASAFLRCLRTELQSAPEAYWEALQAIGRLAETPGLDQVSFYRWALSALPVQATCSRSMLAGFVSVEAALRVDALSDHLNVWKNRCLVRKIHRQLREQRCKSPIVLHRFEKSLARWMTSAGVATDNERLARLIDDLDTTFKYFPYCLSETLSQFPEVPGYAEARDAFEYLDLTSPPQPQVPSTQDVNWRPRDSVFESLPECLGLHEDRSLSCSCACHLPAGAAAPTGAPAAEVQKSKEANAAAAASAAAGERRVLRHCDNCALVSRHHMLLVEKLESRRLRHYDYACVQFPPDFRPRSDLPPAPQVDAEVVVPLYRPASSQYRQNRRSQQHQQHQHRAAESAALLEETFNVTIRAAALYADEDNEEAAAAAAVVEAESTRRRRSALAMTPHDFELAERRRPLFEASSERRRLAERAWTEAEDRAVLQHCQAHGFSAEAFRHLSERVLERRNLESVRQRFRRLMQSYLAAQGAEYSAADMDELSDCDDPDLPIHS